MFVNLVLVLPHEAGVHEVLEVREPLLDPEADGPGGHAVAEQHVADDVPPHQPLPLLVTLQEADHEDGHAEENILLESVKISTSVLKNICTCLARGGGCTGSTTGTRSARRRSRARR